MEFTVTGESPNPHVAFFPLSAGMGHFIPVAEFAKRLCARHGFSVTLIISKWMWKSQQPEFTQRLAASGLDIRFTELPEITVDEDEEHGKFHLGKFMAKAKPHIADVLQSLQNSSSPISAFVIDFFCTELLDVSADLSIPTYLFVPASASFVCLMMHLPKLLSEIEVSVKDADFEVEIPGLPLIPTTDLPSPIQDRSDSRFDWFVYHALRFKEAKGIFINTFAELEEEAIKALGDGNFFSAASMPSIYPIGPLLVESDKSDESDCLKWLDQQPPSSVLFVCFGSGAVLPIEKITELAFGLEASGHRFLWVLRGYKSGDDSPGTNVSQLLPEGFESRTRDVGLVVLNWAPQVAILSHPSTGGFLSHCGWNSTLESVCNGVPMIGWPLCAEQRMNRVILVKQIKVAMDLKMEINGFVGREEVERAVRELMEGEEGLKAREKIRELKEKAKNAIMEGGSTVKATATAASDLSQKPTSDPRRVA